MPGASPSRSHPAGHRVAARRGLEDAGLVSRSRDAQRRPVHLEADVLEQMTSWIHRHQRAAEERYRRLDAVLAELDD